MRRLRTNYSCTHVIFSVRVDIVEHATAKTEKLHKGYKSDFKAVLHCAIFRATCLSTSQSATLQLRGKWCYTRQSFVQLVSQRLNLLRCSHIKGGVTLGSVLCNLSLNGSICYVAVTWKVVTLGSVLCNLSCNVDRKGLGHIVHYETSCRWGCYILQR